MEEWMPTHEPLWWPGREFAVNDLWLAFFLNFQSVMDLNMVCLVSTQHAMRMTHT